eukprot:1927073-Prymnesium_polylepis.1
MKTISCNRSGYPCYQRKSDCVPLVNPGCGLSQGLRRCFAEDMEQAAAKIATADALRSSLFAGPRLEHEASVHQEELCVKGECLEMLLCSVMDISLDDTLVG